MVLSGQALTYLTTLVSMAMIHRLNIDVARRAKTVAVVCAVGLAALLGTRASLDAQTTDVHYRYRADMPPGAIGRLQLQRGGPLRGYFQPVRIQGPPGATVLPSSALVRPPNLPVARTRAASPGQDRWASFLIPTDGFLGALRLVRGVFVGLRS